MSSEDRKFTLKHDFIKIRQLNNDEETTETIWHSDIPWHLTAVNLANSTSIFLECPNLAESQDYLIRVYAHMKIQKIGKKGELVWESIKRFPDFSPKKQYENFKRIPENQYNLYLIDGKLTVECYVAFMEIKGIKERVKRFDEASEFSDVVLIINDRKFHVMKQYLASHSIYFKALFYGNFQESKQSEVELKGIEPKDFQNFLELIHGESLVQKDTVHGIMKLADFFDSKTAMKRCEEHLQQSKNIEQLMEGYHIRLKKKSTKNKK